MPRYLFVCALAAVAATFAFFFLSACTKEPAPEASAPPPQQAAPSNPTSGHIVVGKAPRAEPGASVIVILEPRTAQAFPTPFERPVMDQYGLTFIPPVLLVRTGQPVEFRNSDDTLHNVRVREDTGAGAFNVALPFDGTYVHTFEHDGFYVVGCDIHAAMSAEIVATSTPYVVVADRDGGFTFSDVKPGSYTATVYAGTRRIQRPVEVTGPRTEVSVDEEQ